METGSFIMWIPPQVFGPPLDESDGPFVRMTVLPSEDPSARLSSFWARYKQWMFRMRGEEQPFTDIHRPMVELTGAEFELVEWTPEHAALHAQIQALPV